MTETVFSYEQMIASLSKAAESFPDNRKGTNKKYTIKDAVLGAFSVFFTQCPSFLAHQKALKAKRGKSNAETLFKLDKIPSDNQIRTLLDPASPKLLSPVFKDCFDALRNSGRLEGFRIFNGDLLIALDGTQYFSSKTIHCDNCSTKEHRNGSTTYYHSVITPVVVSPRHKCAIPLEPEFIAPQDGKEKQDCENAAAKRWINGEGEKYSELGVTITGDDLYCKQPICENLLEKGYNFILVCKPDSHKTLYDWVESFNEGEGRDSYVIERWNGRFREIYTYRYANEVPLRDGDDALFVNWCELTITTEEGKVLYRNAFATNHKVTEKNVEAIVDCGRTRWKVENENNNTLKTKGYNLEHNYGHGKKNLSFVLTTLIILSFLFHTILEFMNKKYRLLRKSLPTRKSFFDDIRALTRYICFESWDSLMDFMLDSLDIKFEAAPMETLKLKPG